MLASCSKIDYSQRTAPADYAETERQLIQNREKDSLRGDSSNATTTEDGAESEPVGPK